MNYILLCLSFLIIVVIYPLLGNENYKLQKRLQQVDSFFSEFIQQIIDVDGIVIQKNEGQAWIKYPNLFYFHFIYPNNFFLISDGKLLWFYNPTLNQVTINVIKKIMIDTPLIFFMDNKIEKFTQYNIKKSNDYFFLLPKSHNEYLKYFSIKITNTGVIENFSVFKQEGQCINYQLKNFKKIFVDNKKFIFNIPEGTVIDDQR